MAEQNLTNFTDALEKVKATEKRELPVDNIVRRCKHENAFYAHGYRYYCPDCGEYTDIADNKENA